MFIIHCQCHFCGLTKESETLSASMGGNIGPQGISMPDGWGIVKISTGNYRQTSIEMICKDCLNNARKVGKKPSSSPIDEGLIPPQPGEL